MSEDVLKKPVHVALLRPTHLDELAQDKRIEKTQFGVDPNVPAQPLPVKTSMMPKFGLPTTSHNPAKAAKARVRLKVLHDTVAPIPEDKTPPCDTCKTAACCHVFVVNITEVEYESGLYGDAAVKFTPEIFEQLRSRLILPQMLTAPRPTKAAAAYFLEGKIGEPCPFLMENKRCGIYDIRPRTCRQYTCVGDPRITEGMRQGTEPIDSASILARVMKVAE